VPSDLDFEFHRLRLQFRAIDSLYFPPYKSGNLLRGAFGLLFRRIACVPECKDARTCEWRSQCTYARVFEPQAAYKEGPSGLADWPRPFVFRASHLDGKHISPGSLFHFDIHLFDVREPPIPYFLLAFAQLVQEGLGPRRGRAELQDAFVLGLESDTPSRFYSGRERLLAETPPAEWLSLEPEADAPDRVRVRFVSPTELKSGSGLATRPEFPVLFARLRDRISTLRLLYGAGALPLDFQQLGLRSASIQMIRCEVQPVDVERRSGRTGQVHPLGGFVGEAEYEGPLADFVPYLRAGEWTGVGRQTVWGKGQIAL
jgi:hypothetical protein